MRFKSMTEEERMKIISDPDYEGVPDDENPEWTQEDFDKAKPFAEVFPELAESIIREKAKRGRPKLETTRQQISIRLDPDVIEKFKATGPGWQTRINEALKAAKV